MSKRFSESFKEKNNSILKDDLYIIFNQSLSLKNQEMAAKRLSNPEEAFRVTLGFLGNINDPERFRIPLSVRKITIRNLFSMARSNHEAGMNQNALAFIQKFYSIACDKKMAERFGINLDGKWLDACKKESKSLLDSVSKDD